MCLIFCPRLACVVRVQNFGYIDGDKCQVVTGSGEDLDNLERYRQLVGKLNY